MILPVDSVLPELLDALAAGGNAVLQAPPGAGKTTRVPPALAGAGIGGEGRGIVVLEPRRIAARAAARRIAAERGWEIGREVGWQIRFERRFSRATRILFVTEGVLVQRLQSDPFLDGIGCVVFDELHERSLFVDLALALCRRVQLEARPDLALVAMSATLETERVAAFLGAQVVASEGRLHPIETAWVDRADPDTPLPAGVARGVRRALDATPGDLLVFLPGVGEIRRCEEALAPLAAERNLRLVPLFGDLAGDEQDRALRQGDRRKVVLATNVAETSVTVEGVTGVVDSGLVRRLVFDSALGLDRLELGRVSRAAADQRRGRAGREAPGFCLRLWSAGEESALRPFEVPEIRRADLAWAVLQLAAWGERDVASFPWFEAPEPAQIERAISHLTDLGALDATGLTPLGRQLARLPLAPRLGRLLLEGQARGVAAEAALVAALLSDRDPFRGRTGHAPGSRSDLLDRVEDLPSSPSRSARGSLRSRSDVAGGTYLLQSRDQILGVLERSGPTRGREEVFATAPSAGGGERSVFDRRGAQDVEASARSQTRAPQAGEVRPRGGRSPIEAKASDPAEPLLRAIAAAYLDRLCRRRDPGTDRALMAGGRGVRLARESALATTSDELFVAVVLDAGRAGERSESLVRIASVVDRAWLPAELLQESRELVWDPDRERVAARRLFRFHDLVLEEKEVPISDPAAAASLLAERAETELDHALGLGDGKKKLLRERYRFLSLSRPDLYLPDFDRHLKTLLPSIATGRRSYAELRAVPLDELFLSSLDRPHRGALDREAPERIEVPSGNRLTIDYSDPARPVLAVRIQELFGLAETPRLAGGRVPLLLHLLAPNGRPQQVTPDLASFWTNTYPQVRKELAGRYPKHAWPDDPATARPERRPQRPARR